MKTFLRPLALTLPLTLSAFTLTSCAGQENPNVSTASNSSITFNTAPARHDDAPNESLKGFYGQDIAWDPCSEKFEGYCAKVDIPLDYDDPALGKSYLSLGILPSRSDSPLGTIFINPGGPGGSGIEALATKDGRYDQLLGSYHVVGFDPRGIGESDPIQCYDAQKTDEIRAKKNKDPKTEEGFNSTVKEAKELAAECKKNSNAILEFMDTSSVAKDLDLLRALVGDEKLNYLGYSYGTKIGTIYSILFPDRAGKLVLDGAVDPDLEPEDLVKEQTAGFQKALENYMQFCLTTAKACPFQGTVEEAIDRLKDYINGLKTKPLLSNDSRQVTDSIFVAGIITPLYDNQYWTHLTNALERSIKKNDPSIILLFSDFQAGRDNDGTYKDNSYYAFDGVNCLDNHVTADPQKVSALSDELEELSPIFGEYLAYSDFTCANWAYPPREQPKEQQEIRVGNPPLVIGTTDDPATPYQWAENLSSRFSNSVLITFEGQGHTAFGRNSCVNDAVNRYFLDNIIPQKGSTCAQE